MAKLSIITPIHCWNDYREKSIQRAIDSINRQTFKDFEYLIVNDGSTRPFKVPSWVRLINKEHEERVQAYRKGMEEAKGEIFCFLDSDDEYEPNYLERVDYFFRRWPKYHLFNFGARYLHADGGGWNRGAFRPKKKKVGHEAFGGSQIVNGTFVFHRDVYEDLGGFPPLNIRDIDCTEINYGTKYGVSQPRDLYMGTPYDFSAYAQIEFPEMREFFMVDHENEPEKIIKELGNPWGQDYFLFFKYTRKYHSKPIEEFLYVVHPKTGVE